MCADSKVSARFLHPYDPFHRRHDALGSPRALRPRSPRSNVRTRATGPPLPLYFLLIFARLFCCYVIAYRVM